METSIESWLTVKKDELSPSAYLAAVTAVSVVDYKAASVVLAAAGTADKAWKSGRSDFVRAGVETRIVSRFMKLRSSVDPAKLAEDCRAYSIMIIGLDDQDYPPLLKEIHDPPLGLFVRGRKKKLTGSSIAVVGTRKPTAYGLKWAGILGRELGRAGWTIVSGMALGIDCAVHEAVLNTGEDTVAVSGRGLDKSYPASKKKLFQRIIESGTVISEYPPGIGARPNHFPRRNRIIAGMSRGCVVVEGGLKSGSLITAGLAVEEGRDVFAVPGRIGDRFSEGPNSLLKEGCAKLITGSVDVLDELGCFRAGDQITASKISLEKEEQTVLAALGAAGSNPEEITLSTGLSAAQIQRILVILELKGIVEKSGRGRFYSTME